MRALKGLLTAFATYSRIPVPKTDWTPDGMRFGMCFFPLVGAVVGALTFAWLEICEYMSLGVLIKGAVSAVIPLGVTGGIHMDGFLDTSDALASRQSAEKRLEILKDSHVGAFAVINACAYTLLYAGVFSEASRGDFAILSLGFVCSRALSAIAMCAFKSARENGMLNSFAVSADKRMVVYFAAAYLALCAAAALYIDVWRAVAGIAACAVCFYLYRRDSYKNFGGVTGDLAGHFLQRCELAYAIAVIASGRII